MSAEKMALAHERDYVRALGDSGPDVGLTRVLGILSAIRVSGPRDERGLQDRVAEVLDAAGVAYTRERSLGPRSRVDFLTADGCAVEVKSRPTNGSLVSEQIGRYLGFDEVSSLVLLTIRSANVDPMAFRKPVVVLCLAKLWGVSV